MGPGMVMAHAWVFYDTAWNEPPHVYFASFSSVASLATFYVCDAGSTVPLSCCPQFRLSLLGLLPSCVSCILIVVISYDTLEG